MCCHLIAAHGHAGLGGDNSRSRPAQRMAQGEPAARRTSRWLKRERVAQALARGSRERVAQATAWLKRERVAAVAREAGETQETSAEVQVHLTRPLTFCQQLATPPCLFHP